MTKTVLVTGGTYGIGHAIAQEFSDNGYQVAVLARNIHKTPWEEFQCDVLHQDQLDRVWREISQWDNIDVLINNVGGEGGSWSQGDVLGVPFSLWGETWQRNMGAATFFTLKCLPSMLNHGWGRVVTIASLLGKEGGGRPWYTCAKSAEIALMKSLSRNTEYVRRGITFNSIAPGPIEGLIWTGDTGKHKASRTVMGRLGTPEEVASLVGFLCTQQAGYINGACLSVDGGESLSF